VSRPKILDLFSCAGGMGMGYYRAGFDVYAVDIDPQPNNPFPFYQGDALEVLDRLLAGAPIFFRDPEGHIVGLGLDDFAAAHGSPPCQSFLSFGALNKALGRKYDYPNLIGPTRELLAETGLPYVIENVQDARAHLIDPVRICGTALGLPLRRHRLFESNVPIEGLACDHGRFTEKRYWTSFRPNGEYRLSTVVQVYGNGGNTHEWPAAMGIDWMSNHEMAEAVPPAYAEHIGRQMLAHLERAAA
jgi:DNA (cytosine-5)-methyltransferase 1